MTALTIIASDLTDTRLLEQRLEEAGVPFRMERMGMADAPNRARFASLKAKHGWKKLPLVLEGETLIGGEPEVIQWLQRMKRT